MMASQSKVGFNFIILRGFRVLKIIENINIPAHCLGCDYILVLWHVSGLIYLTLMVNLNIDRNPSALFTRNVRASDAVGVIVEHVFFVVTSVFGGFERYFH